AFAVDYVVELVLARSRALYARREWTSLVIVVSQALAVIPALSSFGVLRALRGARSLRALIALARLVAIGGAAASEGRAILRRHPGPFSRWGAGLTVVTSGRALH